MATECIEGNLEVNSEENSVEESAVCVGDGTTCVECGKAFTHSFYFSTHISTHASHKGFIVVGQCTFCGLVFSDEQIFNAHMASSQSRQAEQVVPEDDASTELIVSDVGSELSSQSNPHSKDNNLEAHQDHNNVPDEDVITTAHGDNAITNVNSDTINEDKPKRKRKASEQLDPNPSTPSPSSKTDSDPAAESYLSSFAHSEITVDPEEIPNHSNIKKHIQISDIGHGQDESQKESPWIECVKDSSSDDEQPKEVSHDNVYLDIDDSPIDDLEVPLEKLEQQMDKLDQTKVQNHAAEINTSHRVSLTAERAGQKQNIALTGDGFVKKSITAEVPFTKLAVHTPAINGSFPTLGPRSVGYHNSNSTRIVSTNLGDKNKTWYASSIGNISTVKSPQTSQIKFNTFTPPNLSQGSKMDTTRIPPATHFVNRNTQRSGSFTLPVSDRSSLYGTQPSLFSNHGHTILNNQQGQVSEKNGNMTRNAGITNVQKSSSLEKLKKDSRENVVEMLQSIGMIALTSTSLAQGKIFPSKKSKPELTLSTNKRVDMIAGFKPINHSGGGLQNRFLGTNRILMTPQQTQGNKNQLRFGSEPFVARSQVSSFGIQSNNHFSPQSFKSNSFFTGLYPQGTGYGRGHVASVVRGQNINVNMRGASSSISGRGRMKPVTNLDHSSRPIRGLGGANTINRQAKLPRASNEIIIIDDDDDDDVVEVIITNETKNVDPVLGKNELEHPAQLESKKSANVKISQEKDDILDDNLACSISDIKTINDKTHESCAPVICSISDIKTINDKTHESCAPVICSISDIKTINDKTHESCAPVMQIDGNLILEEPNCKDESVDVDDAESNAEVGNDLLKSGLNKDRRNSRDSFTPECVQARKENDLCDKKADSDDGNDSDNGLNDNVDIMPGEDIHGWKVCLAEDSDSEDDCSASTSGAAKLSPHEHLPPQVNKKQDHLSPSCIDTNQESSKDNDCLSNHSCPNLISQKLDLASPPQAEASPGSPKQHIWSSQASPKQDETMLLRETLNKVDCHSLDISNQENITNYCSDKDDNNKHDNSSEMMCSEPEDKNCTTEANVDQDNLVSDSSSHLLHVGSG